VGKNDADRVVRSAASRGLAYLGDKRAVPLLQKIMSETTVTQVKISTAKALNRLGDISGFKYVLEAARSKNKHKRIFGMRAMGGFLKSREAIEKKYEIDFLKEYLSFARDPDQKIRMKFAFLLSHEIKNEQQEVRERVIKTLRYMGENDPDLKVKISAYVALGEDPLKQIPKHSK
jgi:HEAT repeat protein